MNGFAPTPTSAVAQALMQDVERRARAYSRVHGDTGPDDIGLTDVPHRSRLRVPRVRWWHRRSTRVAGV